MNLNSKKLLAPTIIIIVTFFAFLAGSLQANYLNQANNVKSKINIETTDIGDIENKANQLYSQDYSYYIQSFNTIQNAINLLLKYYYADSFGINTTITTTTLFNDELNFRQYFYEANTFILATTAFQINFALISNQQYNISTQTQDGYDYIIQKSNWNSVSVISTENVSDYLMRYGVVVSGCFQTPENASANICNLISLANGIQMYTFNPTYYEQALKYPVKELISTQQNNQKIYNQLSSTSDSISRGVIITTIATVLATSMSAGLENKELYNYLSEIRSEVNKDPKYKINTKATVTYIGLLISVIIAVLGLGIPLLFS